MMCKILLCISKHPSLCAGPLLLRFPTTHNLNDYHNNTKCFFFLCLTFYLNNIKINISISMLLFLMFFFFLIINQNQNGYQSVKIYGEEEYEIK